MRLTSKGDFIRHSGAESNRQLTGKVILPETSIANCSVVVASHQDKTINSPSPNPSPTDLITLNLTSITSEGTPLPDLTPSLSILRLYFRASTHPIAVTLTPDLLVLPQSSPEPLPTLPPVPNITAFKPGTE